MLTAFVVLIFLIFISLILYFVMIYPGKRRTSAILNVRYFAHRGLHTINGEEGIPENSMLAFQKAKEAGYGIEMDVQLTKDGEMVIHHDYDLKRTCGSDSLIADLTYEELQTYRLMKTTQTIPRFVDVLEEINGEVPLLIELKMECCNRKLCENVAKVLDSYQGLYCVECFHPYALFWFRKHRPEVIRGSLSSDFVKDEKEGNPFVYWVAKNLLTNCIAKPDFIAYKYKYKEEVLAVKICEKLFHVPVYGWTFRKEEEYEKKKDEFYGFIFEQFII